MFSNIKDKYITGWYIKKKDRVTYVYEKDVMTPNCQARAHII